MVQFKEFGRWQSNRRGSRLNMHRNNGLELVAVTAGTLQWAVEGVVEEVSPGSLFFTMPWHEHGTADDKAVGVDMQWVVIPTQGEGPDDWRFHRDLMLPGPSDGDPMPWRRLQTAFASQRHTYPATNLFVSDLHALVATLQQQTQDALRIRSRLAALLWETVAIIEQAQRAERSQPGTVDRVAEWIATVQSQPLNEQPALEVCAAHCGLARSRFADLVKERTGDSPGRFILRQRLEHAASLLRNSSKSVTEIAFECHFSSSQHFARLFKAYRGETPGEHRALALQAE